MKTKKIYKTPDNYYFRLHHIRPRFKNDIERILLMVSSAVAEMPIQQKEQFDKSLNKIIKGFPGNVVRTDKTINNWRTEISALFSLILYNLDNETEGPSEIAKRMAKNQDLVEFFKLFCYSFQYPGGHLKSQETKKLIERGIKFKPAHYILKLLYQANKGVETPFGINKAEVTHCIFNDTRVTVENKDVKETIDLIKSNREQGFDYDWKGDVIRYAGDIMDYLYYANLLKKHGANYYLNPVEMGAIITFVEKDPWFNLYDKFYGKSVTNEELREAQNKWFYYVSNLSVKANFETDVLAFMGIDKNNYLEIEKKATAIAITAIIHTTWFRFFVFRTTAFLTIFSKIINFIYIITTKRISANIIAFTSFPIANNIIAAFGNDPFICYIQYICNKLKSAVIDFLWRYSIRIININICYCRIAYNPASNNFCFGYILVYTARGKISYLFLYYITSSR